MLCLARSAGRAATGRVIAPSYSRYQPSHLGAIATANLQQRFFFFGSKDDEDDNSKSDKKSKGTSWTQVYGASKSKPSVSQSLNADGTEDHDTGKEGKGKDGNSSSLALPFGDNAPKINPILALPISRRPIFPGFMSAVVVKDEAVTSKIVKNIENGQGYLGLFMRKDATNATSSKSSGNSGVGLELPSDIITHGKQVFNVGTFAQVQSVVKTDHGTQFLLLGHRRVTIEKFTDFGPPAWVNVKHWKKNPITTDRSPALKAYSNEVLTAARELIQINPLAHEHMQQWVSRIDISDPFKLADFAAAMTTADGVELQQVLEEADPEKRLALALELLMKEKELAKLQRDISKQVEEKMTKTQKEYMLREQLKHIKQELGMERDDKDELLTRYQEKVKEFTERKIDPEVLSTIQSELKKLSSLERNSPEFNVTRSYLDWLTAMPWNVLTVDRLDLQQARATLDDDHYGLEDVKKRILEFIAVGKLRGTVAGQIICLIGPPGTGKTSIAKSIATALNKQFYRFSVGGLTDIAEIKGHRRTYIGAMPGKPVQSLKTTQCTNPLILIDEIDKLGRGYSGDPASALLELLDPGQNGTFVDHYLDIRCDFSKVLFVCTANDESAIPGPLKDRMEVIRLTGYDVKEKVKIASRYLVPKALIAAGLMKDPNPPASTTTSSPPSTTSSSSADSSTTSSPATPPSPPSLSEEEVKPSLPVVTITDDALEALVKNYCRESGVRTLEKQIDKIARKIAYRTVGKLEEPNSSSTSSSSSSNSQSSDTSSKDVTVTADNLEEYLGKPKYPQDTIYDSKDNDPLPPGVVMGLAWNPLGGSPVFIETAALPVAPTENGGGVNIITGQLGNVMKESVSIAYTYARQLVSKKFPGNTFFKSHQLHLHVPEGAVEKDGPSAGIAMASSLISIATGTPLRPRLAMTGELSLTGKVLPVGGIKEKVLAARRSGANTVILPSQCKRDYDDLPEYIKDNLTVHFCTDYEQVFQHAFKTDI